MKSKKKRQEYILWIQYNGKLYFEKCVDDKDHMDRVLERMLRREMVSSGMGMWKNARRDVDFLYSSEKAANRAKDRVLEIKGVKKAVVEKAED